MAKTVEYLEVMIDVFDNTAQRARVKKTLSIIELIREIIREFDDLDQKTPETYALFIRGESQPLDVNKTLEELYIQDHDELVFRHARPSDRLLEQNASPKCCLVLVETGQRFEILRHPAIIGRPDTNLVYNELLAVNLQNVQNGMSVSRRHAQILYENEQYFIEPLASSNPTFVNDRTNPITDKTPLHTGDTIYIGVNCLELLFIPGEPQPTENAQLASACLKLIIYPAPTLVGQIYTIADSPYTLGRMDCNLTLSEDNRISRKHAVIQYDSYNKIYTLTDLGGVNGTWIDGIKLDPEQSVQISNGCQIQLGTSTQLEFLITETS